jgi:hypothetical protein
MSVSALSSYSTSTMTYVASNASLVKLANGEYTAASVAKDQKDANRLGLTLLKDGNYGTAAPAATESAGAAQSSAKTLSGLSSLTLGGSL